MTDNKKPVLREIVFDDLYEFLKILEDVKFDFTPDPNKSTEQTGIEAIKHLIANFHTARAKTNAFLGNLCGLSGEEFGKLPIKESSKVVKALVEGLKEADFFGLSFLLERLKR
jgi:hypothetical protein